MTDRPRRVPEHVHWRRFDAELVVVDLKRNEYVGLNDVAADAFELLAKGVRPSEVVESLLAIYDVGPETLKRDIDDLIASLERSCLLVVRSDAGSNGP
jgi:coenzyme PQQ synthesis protein D (PqqD)